MKSGPDQNAKSSLGVMVIVRSASAQLIHICVDQLLLSLMAADDTCIHKMRANVHRVVEGCDIVFTYANIIHGILYAFAFLLKTCYFLLFIFTKHKDKNRFLHASVSNVSICLLLSLASTPFFI